jgi:hypothetical protein
MNARLLRSASNEAGGKSMGKLNQTDKHNPYVQTGQPNPEQTNPQLNSPEQHSPHPLKREVQNKEQEEHKKTGTR